MKKVFLALIALTLMIGSANAIITELVLNGDLEAWTGDVPDNWDMTNRDPDGNVNATPAYTISIETSELHAGTAGTKALKCSRPSSDYTYRYFAFTNVIQPVKAGTNANFSGWLKGANCRCYRARSEDSGVTWLVSNATPFGAHNGSAGWTEVTQIIDNLNDPATIYKIAFHTFSGDGWIDDISVIGDDGTPSPLSATVNPPTTYHITRTQTIEAIPMGGSETYTKVEFDINNDGTIDGTDLEAPFLYEWDTATSESGKAVIPVKLIVYDNTPASGFSVFSYTVDNRRGGRVDCMENGGFDYWQGDMPDGWKLHQPSAATYGPDTDVPEGGAAPSLQVTFPSFDNANRYTLIWKGFQNPPNDDSFVYEDHQVCYWGKGLNCGLRYWTGTDGLTWTDTGLQAASTGVEGWLYAIGSVRATLGALNEWQTISTVNMELKILFDDIKWMATPPVAPTPTPTPTPTPQSVTTRWDIYE
ncbi:hypothetical protein JW926_07440 [Candidatus Sumerlaeota bacterium]|nr:hypothetical protein [Candidatus Sumerlaeota bacterium]